MMGYAEDANAMPANLQKTVQVIIWLYILHFFYTSYSDKPPHTSCSVQRCDNKELVKEQMKYVMVPVQSEGICCPEYNRVACKDGDSVYQVSSLSKMNKYNLQ